MVVSYNSKHLEINDDMKSYLEKKLKKLKFYFDQILQIHVILELQRGQYQTEIKMTSDRDTYFAKDTSATWQESFDKVTDRIENEVKKKKDKIKDHHK